MHKKVNVYALNNQIFYFNLKKLSSKTFANELAAVSDDFKSVEAQNYDFEAGGFSETTTLDGKVVFSIGALEQDDGNLDEAVRTHYMWQGNLNTSFNGDDNLYVRLKTGNGAGWMAEKDEGGYLSATNTGADEIHVDKIWYTFPLGERQTVWIGPSTRALQGSRHGRQTRGLNRAHHVSRV